MALRFWLERETRLNPAWIFGLQTTLPVGESMYIIQMKERRHFIALEASLTYLRSTRQFSERCQERRSRS